MAKNIIICCDGTGNEFGDHNSNAAWSVVKGLAFGSGLLSNVGDTYRYLMNVYEDGDQIYLFGFSRGAYTVRAIAGVLHMFGLLCPGNDGLIPYITRLYAKKTRDAAGMTHTFEVAEGFKSTFCRHCPLHLVGVWDTVSSVGWVWDPLKLPYTGQNPDMKNGRHAVSIDERRCYFRNNLWGNQLPGQNINQVWFVGVHSDVGGSYAPAESGLSQITLEWMLCEAVPLGLLVDPARADQVLGRIPPPKVPPPPPVLPDPAAKTHNSLTLAWWFLEFLPHSYYDPVAKKAKWRIPLGATRVIPGGSVLHETVKEKLNIDPDYKPRNLPQSSGIERRNACRFS